MKLFAKLLLATVVGGAASIYAGTGGWLSPNGGGSTPPTGSFAEMLARAGTLHAQMDTDVRDVQQMQISARKQKDLIRLNCLNDKLVEMKPQVNIADRSQADLAGAQTPADQQAAFAALSSAHDAVEQLHEAAQQCAGKPLLTTESSNEYTHPNLDQPPEYGSVNGEIEPPAYASPIN